MLECVVNLSEGRRSDAIRALVDSVDDDLLDVHTDEHHNRSVFTLIGEDAPRRLARVAIELLDIRDHQGVHPRIGVVDVVPFVPLGDTPMREAIRARDDFAAWISREHGIPAFVYGKERTLPDIRKNAFVGLRPDHGPTTPHPSAGAVCVGARDILVAYNVVVADVSFDDARILASSLRSPDVRALALRLGDEIQVSMNLINPLATGPADVYDLVEQSAHITRAELVGLVPAEVLASTPSSRWKQLGLGIDRTIEFRLAQRATRH